MKTLDEVIQNLGDGTEHLSAILVSKETWGDALHYLKEYRDKMNILEVRMAEYKRGFEQLGVEWSRIKDNPPLTWDELCKMEGKPVWVEIEDGRKVWAIPRRVSTLGGNERMIMVGAEDGYAITVEVAKNSYNGWQAYRKERNESN